MHYPTLFFNFATTVNSHYMGIYLNPNNKGFKGFLNKKIYVDKTMLISELNNFTEIAASVFAFNPFIPH